MERTHVRCYAVNFRLSQLDERRCQNHFAMDVWGNWRLNFLSREGREGGEVRRTGIIVEPHRINSKAPSGATSSEYAAPTGLKIILVLGSTNMPRLTALGTARRRKRQPGRSRSPLRTGRALRNSQFEMVRASFPVFILGWTFGAIGG
jgi:hypothetical protein